MKPRTRTARIVNLLVVLLGLVASAGAAAAEYFPLQQVRLLDSPFRDAQDRDIDYILALQPDRLLAPYLTEAGLPPRAENYGNWESSGLDGHIAGHTLSALSLAWAATGREDVHERLEYMLDELERVQKQNGNGYLGGVPGSAELWKQIAAGDIRAEPFGLNGAWVPWYNLHKMFAGLRDAWLYTGSTRARGMLVAFADWAGREVASLSDEQMQTMLQTEQGGMNEVLADVYAITGDARYLALARRFSDHRLLDPLLDGKDALTGLHANTQIPKVIGFERISELDGDEAWHKAAEFFWEDVVDERSIVIGGHGVGEHFNDRHDFSSMMTEVQGPETCNTYNMLKLTQRLYGDSPELKYVSFYERALYNHILSSQDPATGGVVYFTPMRPEHYRIYSQLDQSMWCCVGTGIENHVKYGAFIYARDGDALTVNLYIPSRLSWPEKNLVLRQENEFPDRAETRLVFESDARLRLELRYPGWVNADHPALTINGKEQAVTAAPGSYIELDRDWKQGDTVSLALPMAIHAEQLPDRSNNYALEYGPIVLAARNSPFPDEKLDYYAHDTRMGQVPAGPMCPIEKVPVFVAESPDFARYVHRVGEGDLRFRIEAGAGAGDFPETDLIPFFRLHRSRYTIYWPFSTPDKLRPGESTADEDAP
jgi:uncharacterized protein